MAKQTATFTSALDRAGIPWTLAAPALEDASVDFGRVVRGSPRGVISPITHEQTRELVLTARKHRVGLTARTHGYSQSGQSISQEGFVLDLSRLSRVGAVDASGPTIECDAGASWRSVMNASLAQGLIPKVMPMNLDLSVGGTLSAGGVGASCHRHGNCAAAVASVSFVTGAGDIVRCSRQHDPDLFASALGGQGRCGVLLSVTLELRATTGRVETCYLLYDSVAQCLASLSAVAEKPEIAYAEAYCSSLFQGLKVTDRGRGPLMRWFAGLQVTREIDRVPPASDAWLDGLGWREIIHRETDSIAGFSARYDLRFELMRKTGDFAKPHPWFECFLPPSRAASVISQALDLLPPVFGDGHRIFLLQIDERLRYLSMPLPEAGHAVAFAILPTAVPEAALSGALPILERLDEIVQHAGGKRYLSGWIPNPRVAYWQRHYGLRYEDWIRSKLRYDPDGVLSSALFASLDAELYGRSEAVSAEASGASGSTGG
jgi:cytokinin dehydrogenase